MAQFDLYRIDDQNEWFVSVQHDMLSPLDTTVVVPLRQARLLRNVAGRLSPKLLVNGEEWVLFPPALAAVCNSVLRPSGLSLAPDRDAILAALGLLFFGI